MYNIFKIVKLFFCISQNLYIFFQNFQQIFPKSSEEFVTILLKLIQCQRDLCLFKSLISVSRHRCHKKLLITVPAVAAICASHVNTPINAYTKSVFGAHVAATSVSYVKVLFEECRHTFGTFSQTCNQSFEVVSVTRCSKETLTFLIGRYINYNNS